MNPKQKELLLCIALLAPASASMMPAWGLTLPPMASPIEATQPHERVATGIVEDEHGEPIIGATVQVIGTGTGTITDINGRFRLVMPAGKTQIRVSYVGMESQDFQAKENLKIMLKSVAKGLDEVIVVAYGTSKKSAFTGSAAVVDSKEIGKVQATNPLDAMKGKAAGVQMVQASGQPGIGSPTIRVRGISSINAGNGPLIIVDGSPYDGNLNMINPLDIESETVLKDAASAALYGARGANGVILITTKSGKRDHSSISFDAKWGQNSRQLPDYNYIDHPAAYYEMWYKGLYNYAMDKLGYSADNALVFANEKLTGNDAYGLGYNIYTVPQHELLIGRNGKLNPRATLGNTVTGKDGKTYMLYPDDWTDATFRNSLREEYSLTTNYGTPTTTFYMSTSYLKMNGISLGSDYRRISARFKGDAQVKPWLKLFGNVSYANYKANSLRDDGNSASPSNVFALTKVAPIYPLYFRDAQGNILYDQRTGLPLYDYGDGATLPNVRAYMNRSNPLSDNQLDSNGANGNTFNGAGNAEIRFLKDFRLSLNNTVFWGDYRGTTTYNPWYGQNASQKGHVYKKHDRTLTYTLQQLLNWHRVFGKHDVEVMLGHEYFRYRYYNLNGDKLKTFSYQTTELNGAIQVGNAYSYMNEYNTEGYFGRAQYNYDNRYFGSLSFRRDASSRFDPAHRWGNFWSFGGAWMINKENWLVAPWVDQLKLKLSYGEQGNDNIGNFRYITYYNIENSNGNVSLTPASLGNANITWEKGGNFNVGVEFSLFHERLGGDIEYFYRKTSDMLSWFTLPGSFGFKGYWANVGDMRNSGVELELHGDIIRTKDITWTMRGNITTYKNKITHLSPAVKRSVLDGVEGYNDGDYFYGEGLSIYSWRMFRYAGVDHETGEALYYKNIYKYDGHGNRMKDAAGHDIIEGTTTTKNAGEASYYNCGTALPDAYGGFGTSLSAYGFDFSMDFVYQLGGKAYDSGYADGMSFARGMQFHADLEKAWSPANKGSNIPRIQYNDVNMARFSDRFLTSASYLNLQNITLGYTLPARLITRFGLQNVRVYMSGENIWLWSKRQGFDPRQSTNGGNSSTQYSPLRTISGGISITF